MNTMTIGKKITLACVVLVALTVLLGTVSIFKIGQINQSVESITKQSFPSLNYMASMVETGKEEKFQMMSHMDSTSPAQMAQAESNIAQQQSKFEAAVKGEQNSEASPRGRQLLENILSADERFTAAWAKVLPLSRASKNEEARAAWDADSEGPAEDRDKALDDLIVYIGNGATDAGKTATETGENARTWSMLILALSVTCGGALAFFIVRGINKAMTQAVTELSDGADQVSSAAGQVSSSSQSLAQGASEQAASLEETSASSEEVSSMTRKNAENSQQAAEFMNGVSQRVAEANRTLADMTTSMQEIGESSGKISKIIKVIDEIAFQTNILALNAAVEAARAGEAGMGFAVVADEVRNLAQRSAQAAKDTATLIEDSILKSGEGSRKLGEVAGSIGAITEGAAKVKMLVDEVEASSKEQSQGIQQIAKAVAEMEQVTQKTAANAEESASASEELSAQSQALTAVVVQLQAMVGAGVGAGAGSGNPAVSRQTAPFAAKRPVRAVQITRGLPPARNATRKPALAGAVRHHTGEFPLDEGEFKEF
jgi:methyl-accepting chemotaxis protein